MYKNNLRKKYFHLINTKTNNTVSRFFILKDNSEICVVFIALRREGGQKAQKYQRRSDLSCNPPQKKKKKLLF